MSCVSLPAKVQKHGFLSVVVSYARGNNEVK